MLRTWKALSPIAQGVLLMVVNSLIWGFSNGVLSGSTTHPLLTGAIVYTVMAGVLVLITRITHHSLKAAWLAMRTRRVLVLSGLEVGIILAFLIAVRFAPLGPVVAIQLTFPIMLMIRKSFKSGHPLTSRNALTIALIAFALVIVGATSSGGGHANVWIGLSISFLSALMMAVYTEILRDTAITDIPGAPATAVLAIVASVLLIVATFIAWSIPGSTVGQVRLVDIGTSLGVGLLCGLAALASWEGSKRLDTVLSGYIRLGEPPVASLFALWIWGTPSSLAHLLAVAMVMAAVLLGLPSRTVSLAGVQPSPRKEALPM
jgi:drug/metabolite transporter (DMT)-like permease